MSDVAIRVENLGKRYRIGSQKEQYGMLRDIVMGAAKAPLRRLRRGDRPPAEEFWALRDVSFELKQGEILGVIGRNGAGKSTLLKILSRITEPTAGRATIHGRVGSLLEVGTGFHPELTGRENIYLNGAIIGMSRQDIDRRFDEIVEFAGVERFLDTPVKRYSSGMQTRLAFSVAAHLEPEVLIIDEVLAVGDISFQRKSVGKIGDVAREGRTVLFVSHHMASVEGLCTRGIVLDDGKTVCDGNVETAIRSYVTSLPSGDELSSINTVARKGNGRIRFRRITFLDADTDESITSLRVGQDVRIRLQYDVIDPTAIGTELKVGIGFIDSMGQFKFAVNNEAVGYRLWVSPTGRTETVIPKFPLSQGSYRCYVYSEVAGEAADWIPDGVRIDVIPGDYYGHGKVPAEQLHGFYVLYEWIH